LAKPMFGGTPSDWVELLTDYTQLGVSSFQVWFLDGVNLEPLKLFAREVIPKLKGMSVG